MDELFGTLRSDPIVSPRFAAPKGHGLQFGGGAKPTLGLEARSGLLSADAELADQFLVFQFSADENGPRLLDTTEVAPEIEGSDELPDTLVRLQMVSFHVGKKEPVDKNTRATLRLDLGKDESSNSLLDTVFWSVAAGLKLYDEAKGGPSEAKALRSDFNDAFSQRPVEIPGSLGLLSFEVVKHEEPKWWERVFKFLYSDTGKALTSALGFPAITSQAIRVIDELVGRLDGNDPDILFKSRPMTLALSQQAKSDFGGGLPDVQVGSLNAGFCLIARGRDYPLLLEHEPAYMANYGLMRPASVNVSDFLSGNFDDPFRDVTYGVLRVGTQATKLSPTVAFR